jgi:methylglutaconyl-CoA hydratase
VDEVKIEVARGVLTATLCDEENRNALGVGLVSGLRDAIRQANADPDIRAIVVTNVGSTFCAGANLKERSKANESKKTGKGSGGMIELFQEIRESSTPVIGRIAGHVMGGGNGLAATLDISIASADVKFGFTEVRLGVIPAMISVVCLPKMRDGDAMELFLRGNRIPAARAAELGLINRAVPADQLDAAVEEVLGDLRKGGPNALGLAKALVYDVPKMSDKEAFEYTGKLSNQLFSGEEAKEGMQAFLQKRPASWAVEDDD